MLKSGILLFNTSLLIANTAALIYKVNGHQHFVMYNFGLILAVTVSAIYADMKEGK